MDPASLHIIMKNLAPVLGIIVMGVIPIGIIWVLKAHKVRMRELELEEKAILARGAEGRMASLEQRMAAVETALGAPPQSSLEQRAAMLEGPAQPSSTPTRPDIVRIKQR